MSKSTQKKQRGGARAGAGRKKIDRPPSASFSVDADAQTIADFKAAANQKKMTYRDAFEKAIRAWSRLNSKK